MSREEYWIGKNVDLSKVWKDFYEGQGYVDKFYKSDIFKLVIKFENYSENEAVFNFEAMYKSFKSAFHDLKQEVFTPEEYINLAPLYFYELKRGSEEWSWLGELEPLIVFGFAIFPNLANAGLDTIKKVHEIKNLRLDRIIKEQQIDEYKQNTALKKIIEAKPTELKIIDPKTGEPFLNFTSD